MPPGSQGPADHRFRCRWMGYRSRKLSGHSHETASRIDKSASWESRSQAAYAYGDGHTQTGDKYRHAPTLFFIFAIIDGVSRGADLREFGKESFRISDGSFRPPRHACGVK